MADTVCPKLPKDIIIGIIDNQYQKRKRSVMDWPIQKRL